MLLDVRLPIGGLFLILGLLIGGYGLWAGLGTSAGRLDATWGAIMAVFGALTTYFGWRATVRVAPAEPERRNP
jgi:hypothetical protein